MNDLGSEEDKNEEKKIIPSKVLLEKRIKKIISDHRKKGHLLFPLAEIGKAQLNLLNPGEK
ncbi:MAG: hypothetical protein NT116_01755 [Candidatus Parcubacteria bacterium]|nr:hypothetical protein [Candidatus Parcubacteria bacterium]